MSSPDAHFVPTALVTGASRGIGAAIATRLAHDGFDVIVHYHQDAAGAKKTAAAVEAAGRKATVEQADLGDGEQAWALAERACEHDLGLYVNNAGIYDRRAMQDMTGEAWWRTIDVNLNGAAAICQVTAPKLQAAGGSIIHISSIVAYRGTTHGQHYAATKSALIGLTRSQALEWAPLRVNAIAPGYIATDILAGDSPEKTRQRESEVPMGRVGTPEDVAAAASFLARAGYVTGHVLHVNGGLWTE